MATAFITSGNAIYGIQITGGSSGNFLGVRQVQRNVIGNNALGGINIQAGSNTFIQGNHIGVSVTDSGGVGTLHDIGKMMVN